MTNGIGTVMGKDRYSADDPLQETYFAADYAVLDPIIVGCYFRYFSL